MLRAVYKGLPYEQSKRQTGFEQQSELAACSLTVEELGCKYNWSENKSCGKYLSNYLK